MIIIKSFFSAFMVFCLIFFLASCSSEQENPVKQDLSPQESEGDEPLGVLPVQEEHDNSSSQEEEIVLEESEKPLIVEDKKLTFQWSLDSGDRIIDGSVPYIYKTNNGKYRLYYCGQGGIISALSSDALSFVNEKGVRVSSPMGAMACDATIIDLPDGSIRMYYKLATGQGGPGQSVHKILSAVSSDGLNFDLEGVRIDSEKTDDRGWASVPEAIMLPDGRIRIYYVSDSLESGHGIVSAVSSDGLNFKKEQTKLTGFVDPAIIILPDGNYLLLASVLPKIPGKENLGGLQEGIYSFISQDGIIFSDMKEVYLGKGAIDPSIIRLDDNKWRVFFWNHNDSPPKIKSITGITE